MTDARRPLLGAIAVVLHEDRVLLARRRKEPDAGLWGFPGGHVEWGETALDAAARELLEETGVVAEPLDYIAGLDVMRRDDAGEVAAHYLLAAVLCRYVSGTPVAADDVIDARWFPVAQALDGSLPSSARVDEMVRLAQARLRRDRIPPSTASR